jgi:hypothetical protein
MNDLWNHLSIITVGTANAKFVEHTIYGTTTSRAATF